MAELLNPSKETWTKFRDRDHLHHFAKPGTRELFDDEEVEAEATDSRSFANIYDTSQDAMFDEEVGGADTAASEARVGRFGFGRMRRRKGGDGETGTEMGTVMEFDNPLDPTEDEDQEEQQATKGHGRHARKNKSNV